MQINLNGSEIEKVAREKAMSIAITQAKNQIEDYFNSGQSGNHTKGSGHKWLSSLVQEILESSELKDLIKDRVAHFLVKHVDECTSTLVQREIRKLGNKTLKTVEHSALS